MSLFCCWSQPEQEEGLDGLLEYDFETHGEFAYQEWNVPCVVKMPPVDGDTMDVAFYDPPYGTPGATIRQFRVRFIYCDTPELIPKGQTYPNARFESREAEQQAARDARDALASLVPESRLGRVSITKRGKFGRLLATLYFNKVNANKWLLENGFAEPRNARGQPCELEELPWF